MGAIPLNSKVDEIFIIVKKRLTSKIWFDS